jgi:acyl carrier protein
MPHENAANELQLVAYIVSATEVPPTVGELRRDLAITLPAYMIPSSFVVMREFPLAPNGKILKSALPAPGATRTLDARFVAPRTELEQQIADIWCTVLGLKSVGVDDPFCEVGGDSLQATRITSRLKERFSTELPIHELLSLETIAATAAHIDRHAS